MAKKVESHHSIVFVGGKRFHYHYITLLVHISRVFVTDFGRVWPDMTSRQRTTTCNGHNLQELDMVSCVVSSLAHIVCELFSAMGDDDKYIL